MYPTICPKCGADLTAEWALRVWHRVTTDDRYSGRVLPGGEVEEGDVIEHEEIVDSEAAVYRCTACDTVIEDVTP